MIYDGQNPKNACGPNAHKNPEILIRIKLRLIIGRRPYLLNRKQNNNRRVCCLYSFTYQPTCRKL